ncbi:MAG: tryptophan synthase subunit alpha [Myxococcales bacterium]|nr:tryptophan synthase subunit alpha [Myxococcales bacterium]
MTNRIRVAFDRAADENRAALLVYVCAGDPNLGATEKIVKAISEAGADVIELGVPFSDPTADGIVIQRASERALKAGTTVRGVLDSVKRMRQHTDTPILLFGYYNPLFAYGVPRIVSDAKEAGVDGFLIVDLPLDAAEPLRAAIMAAGLAYVPLAAPTSSEERIAKACESSNGFLYYVSMTGVTGSSSADLLKAARQAKAIQTRGKVPVAVGFGIKTPDDVAVVVAEHVQGVVVGSAVVNLLAQASDLDRGLESLKAFIRQLKNKTHRQGVVPV